MTTSGGRRDPDEVRAGLTAWLWEHRPDLGQAEVGAISHPSAGFSNETVVVDVNTDEGHERLVVRLPPLVPTFPDADLATQVEVMRALAGTPVPVPTPVTYEPDEAWLGAPFVVMPFVEGDIPGAATVLDPWLTGLASEDQRTVQDQMVAVLGDLHRLEWRSLGVDELLRGGDRGLAGEVAYWRHYLDWANDGSPRPRLVELVEWCEAHRPTDEPPASLLWGDARLENLILDESRRTRVVLDWELASLGPAEMDLGWFLGLDRVLRELTGGMVVPGFRADDELIATYEARLGRPLRHLAYHAAFAVVRSICINSRQARISAEAGVDYPLPGDETNPLVGIVERWMAELP